MVKGDIKISYRRYLLDLGINIDIVSLKYKVFSAVNSVKKNVKN